MAPQGPAPSREVQVQVLRATLLVISGSSSGVPPGVPDYLLSSHFCQLGIQVHGLVVSEAFALHGSGESRRPGERPSSLGRKKQRSPPDTSALVFLPPSSQIPPTQPLHARFPLQLGALPTHCTTCTGPVNPTSPGSSPSSPLTCTLSSPPRLPDLLLAGEATRHRPAPQAHRDVLPRSHLFLQDPCGGTKSPLTVSNN